MPASPHEARRPIAQPPAWPGALTSPCPGLPTPARNPQGHPTNPYPGSQGLPRPSPGRHLPPHFCVELLLFLFLRLLSQFAMMSPPTCSKKPPSCLVPSQWSPRNPCDLSGPLRLWSPAGAKPNSPARETGLSPQWGSLWPPLQPWVWRCPGSLGLEHLCLMTMTAGGVGIGGTSEPGLTEGDRP